MPSTRDDLRPVANRVVMTGLAAGWAWIALASLPYFVSGPLHPFLIEKLPLSTGRVWRATLSVHVLSALFALPACTLLLSDRVRRRWIGAHRVLGRVVGVVVLCGLIPSGAYLAWTATGGLPSTLGFLLSGAIMGAAMVRAVITARRHQLDEHRRAVRHVVGQMAVAVISRAMLVAAGALELDPLTAYVVSLWVPVVGVVLAVEWISARPHISTSPTPRGATMVLARRLLLSLALLAGLASTSEAATSGTERVLAQLHQSLIAPLIARESTTSRFSRAPRPPAERRARLLSETASVDATGAQFYAFAIDQRWSREAGAEWEPDAVVGCIYPTTGKVFVRMGDTYMASAWLLGTEADTPPATVCAAR